MGVKTYHLTEQDINLIKTLDAKIESFKVALETETARPNRRKILDELTSIMSYRDTIYPTYPKPVSSVNRSAQSYADEQEELFIANLRGHVAAHEADGDYRTANALKGYINTHIAKTAEFKANPPKDMWPKPESFLSPLAGIPDWLTITALAVTLGTAVGALVHFS